MKKKKKTKKQLENALNRSEKLSLKLAHERDHVAGGLALEVRVVAQQRRLVLERRLRPRGVGLALQAKHVRMLGAQWSS